MPIILSAKLLRTIVIRHTEYTENLEYSEVDDENYEKCRTTIALLESSLRQIKEAKEDLQKLHREIQNEHKNCKDNSEKREILAEIQQIEEDSQLRTATAEANNLIVMLTAKLNESKNTRRNMEIFLGYMSPRAQNLDASFKDDSKNVQNIGNNTEQNRNYMSLPSVSQASYSNQGRCNPVALLKKEIAANTSAKKRLGQKNNGRVTQSRGMHTNYRPNYGAECIFCHKGNHSAVRCRSVTDQSMRRKTLREQNRCWKCFSINHNSFVCRKQDCSSCGQKHHSSLCFKKEAPDNYGKERTAITMASNRPNLRDSQICDQRTINNQPSRTKTSPLIVQMCAETMPGLNVPPPKVTNRQTVLMTAEGSLWNARREQFEKVLFLFDSGAQKTVVEEELVEQFGLPKKTTKMCTISGGGGHRETFKSHTVHLKIGTAFGEDIKMTVETLPVITSGFPSVKLDQIDVAFLKTEEIYLANTKIRGEHQIPRVLVGLDYYHDLVTDHLTKTPSGLHIVKTVFGPVIHGSGLTETRQVESVNYNLTAMWEDTEYHAVQKGSDLGKLGTTQNEHRRAEKVSKYSSACTSEAYHSYGFTASSLPLKEHATHIANDHPVAMRRLHSSQLQPSAINLKPPSTSTSRRSSPPPPSRRSPPTPASLHRPQRLRAVLRRRPPQGVDLRRTTTTRKKAKISDINSDNSCRPPEYHRQIDDPCSIHIYRRYCTSCGGGGADPSRPRDTCSESD